jgi:acetyl-CoA C-acetyltransferase
MTDIVIASAARTAVGSFNGAFANTPAHELGATAIRAVLERAGVDASEVSETILGQVLTAGQGQNPARQAHINAGLPQESAAWGINQVCGSGLRAVALAAQHITLGDAEIVVAGGQESMSLSPHVAHLRAGQKMGDMKFVDSMIKDGLWDAFNDFHMGTTAENVAQQWQITREQQDEFAVASQNKAEAAQKAAASRTRSSPTPLVRKGRRRGDNDEVHPRPAPTIDAGGEAQARLLKGRHGDGRQRVGINDGPRALLLMTADEAQKRGLPPRPHRLSATPASIPPSWARARLPSLPQGPGEGRLEGPGPRSRGGQRGLRGPGPAR